MTYPDKSVPAVALGGMRVARSLLADLGRESSFSLVPEASKGPHLEETVPEAGPEELAAY